MLERLCDTTEKALELQDVYDSMKPLRQLAQLIRLSPPASVAKESIGVHPVIAEPIYNTRCYSFHRFIHIGFVLTPGLVCRYNTRAGMPVRHEAAVQCDRDSC